jgi:quinol monooxygenase YgiN
MSIEYIRYKIHPDSHEAFIAAYSESAKSLDASEYCQSYELSQCEEEPERFILRIEWSSTEDHLQGFRKSKEFRSFLPSIRPYIDNIEEMQHYQKTVVCASSKEL